MSEDMSLLEMAQLDTSQYIYPCPLQVCYHSRPESPRPPMSQANWDALKAHLDMFHNALLQFNVPSYSIHVDRSTHVTFHDATISCQLILATSQAGATPGAPASPWQKVMATPAYRPRFCLFFFIQCAVSGMTCWATPSLSVLPESQLSV
jgi:hypothetical protein